MNYKNSVLTVCNHRFHISCLIKCEHHSLPHWNLCALCRSDVTSDIISLDDTNDNRSVPFLWDPVDNVFNYPIDSSITLDELERNFRFLREDFEIGLDLNLSIPICSLCISTARRTAFTLHSNSSAHSI